VKAKNRLTPVSKAAARTLAWSDTLRSLALYLSPGRSIVNNKIRDNRSLSFDSDDDGQYEMTQTYGIASERSPDPASAGLGEESRALLGPESVPVKQRAEGHANIVSSVSNLANTIIGSGK
jgi:hypothetical protein